MIIAERYGFEMLFREGGVEDPVDLTDFGIAGRNRCVVPY